MICNWKERRARGRGNGLIGEDNLRRDESCLRYKISHNEGINCLGVRLNELSNGGNSGLRRKGRNE